MTVATASFTVRRMVAQDYVQLAAAARLEGVVDPERAGRAFEESGPAFTAVGPHGVLLGCAGLTILWPGRALAWAVVHPQVRHVARVGAWFHRETRRRLEALVREHRLRRVEADCRADQGAAIGWLFALGFDIYQEAPDFGPHGETFLRMQYVTREDARARIRAWHRDHARLRRQQRREAAHAS